MKMDSRIPKLSALKKPATGNTALFDFKMVKEKLTAPSLPNQNKPLSGKLLLDQSMLIFHSYPCS